MLFPKAKQMIDVDNKKRLRKEKKKREEEEHSETEKDSPSKKKKKNRKIKKETNLNFISSSTSQKKNPLLITNLLHPTKLLNPHPRLSSLDPQPSLPRRPMLVNIIIPTLHAMAGVADDFDLTSPNRRRALPAGAGTEAAPNNILDSLAGLGSERGEFGAQSFGSGAAGGGALAGALGAREGDGALVLELVSPGLQGGGGWGGAGRGAGEVGAEGFLGLAGGRRLCRVGAEGSSAGLGGGAGGRHFCWFEGFGWCFLVGWCGLCGWWCW